MLHAEDWDMFENAWLTGACTLVQSISMHWELPTPSPHPPPLPPSRPTTKQNAMPVPDKLWLSAEKLERYGKFLLAVEDACKVESNEDEMLA